jgi:uncharacterized protein DUF1259
MSVYWSIRWTQVLSSRRIRWVIQFPPRKRGEQGMMRRQCTRLAATAGLALMVVAMGPIHSWAQALNTAAITEALGRTGQMMPGDVYRVGFPRTDLHVTLDGVTLKPGLALGSYAVFKQYGKDTMMMGDLALLQMEIEPVMKALIDGGVEITAVHNHLLRTNPPIMWMHYMGMGDAGQLATSLRKALATSKTPLGVPSPSAPEAAPWFKQPVEQVLGRTGTVAGGVLGFSVRRAVDETSGGMTLPPSMGMVEGMSFQDAGNNRIAATGDFAVTEDEVNPVLILLRDHGIDVTALHSHMLDDTPRLFFMHFWAVGDPSQIAAGLKAALDHVKTR